METLFFPRSWSDPALLMALIGLLYLVFLQILRFTYVRADQPWPDGSVLPKYIPLSTLDYIKAFIAWMDGYRRTYAIPPGLYYTGKQYDNSTPLLVTANYQLTVFLLLRRCRKFNVRLLVIDSDAINVWCSAGKGRFCNARIIEQLERYDRNLFAKEGKRIRLILPKFGFPGVDYRALFHHHYRLRPVIGPLYAKDLPEYLGNPPYKDRREDRANFALRARIFSWLPGLVQNIGYYIPVLLVILAMEVGLGHRVAVALLVLPFIIATLYPLLFPLLPGRRFAVKGVWLALLLAVGLAGGWMSGLWSGGITLTGVLFSSAASIFFALSYTGNSAVSNYTSVRKETAQFLPWSIGLMLAAASAFLYFEWPS